ncbi:MAG: hypothetical protein ABII82_20265 [Verrucomicrobiota bacterium]
MPARPRRLSPLLFIFVCFAAPCLAQVAHRIPFATPWQDNGAWANSPANISRHTAEAGARVESQGFAQIFLPMPALVEGAIYRVRVTADLAGQIETVSVRVRKRVLPYTLFGSRDYVTQDNRMAAELQFRTPASTQSGEFGLFLIVTGTGTLDVTRTTLERLPEFDIPADPVGPRGQLLANPDFALLDAGWVLAQARIESDHQSGGRLVLSPEPGSPATAVQIEPVALRLGQSYRLEVSGENLAGLHASLRGAKRETIRRFTLDAGENGFWSTRFSLTPPESGLLELNRPAVLGITFASGSAVLKHVRLVESPDHQARSTVVPPAANVSFEVAGRRVPRVVGGDPLSLAVRTSGIDVGTPLSVRIRDWDGTVVRQVDRPVGRLPDGTTGFVVTGVQLPPGWFDTEVGPLDRNSPAVATVPGEIAVLPPMTDATPSDASSWVLGHHLQYWRTEGSQEPRRYLLAPDSDSTLEDARRLGVQSVRFHPPMTTKWWQVEPVRGQWRFTDELIDAPLAHGISVLGMLDGTPRFASSAPALQLEASKGWPRNWAVYPAKKLDDWRAYVRTTVTRYRDRVRVWEIWDEPDSRMFLGMPDGAGEHDTPERVYTSLVRAAAAEIRAIDPGIKIVAGSVTGGGLKFLVRAIRDEGLMEHCDVISFHGYGRVRASDRGAGAFADIVGAINRAAGRKVEIWDTEAALGTMPEGRAGLRIAETELKGILARRAAGINRLYFYNGFRRDDPLHGDFRVLWGYDDRRPLAIQPLLAASQWLLAGTEFETALVDEPEGAHLYVFRRADGRRVAAGWTSSPSGATRHQAGSSFRSGRIFTQTGADAGRYEDGVLPLVSSVRYFVLP